VKAGWATTTLGDLLSVQNGYAFDSKLFGAEGYPLIRIRDIKEGITTETKFSGPFDSKYVVNAGDFLIGMDGEFGCHEWKGPPALLNQRVCRLQGFHNSLEPRFLLHGINAHLKAIEEVTGYTTVKHLSSKQILAIEMLVPPRSEQHCIVTLLDEAFADIATAKAKAEKNLQNARVLFESYRNSVFESRGSDWGEVRLGELCDFLNGFAFKSGDAVDDSGTQLVRMGNLYGGKLDLERNAVYYPDTFASEYQRFLLHEGDIIMSLTGTTGKEDFGFAVQVPETDRALLMNQRIVKFESIRQDKICRKYLLHYLCSRVFLNLLYPTANGTRQANLSSVTMKMLPVPTPSVSLQQQIARSLDSLEVETQHLETIYRQKLTALDDLKKSLLHQAFSGQL